MTRKKFDETYSCIKLADLLSQADSKKKVQDILKTFSCLKNKDLKNFLHNKSITFEQNFRSRTFLYIDETKQVVAYYTIAISSLLTENLDSQTIKFLDGHQDNMQVIPHYLIGQLGKSDTCKHKIGNFILADALNAIDECQKKMGGRFISVDAINEAKVIEFYRKNSFIEIENNTNKTDSIKMIKPYFDF